MVRLPQNGFRLHGLTRVGIIGECRKLDKIDPAANTPTIEFFSYFQTCRETSSQPSGLCRVSFEFPPFFHPVSRRNTMQRILAGLVTALAVVVLPQYAAAQDGKRPERPEGPPMFNARVMFDR